MSEIPPPTVPPATPPPPPPPTGGSPASSDRTVMLVLSYLGILALIPLLTKKDDAEIQWHAKNGLAIAIAIIVIWIPIGIMCHFIPFLGCLVMPVACIFPLLLIVLAVMCINKALNGQRLRIPVITDFAEKMQF